MSDDPASVDMPERLRLQIARMVQGNGLQPEAIAILARQSHAVTLFGQLDIRLVTKTENTSDNGICNNKWKHQFDSPAALQSNTLELQQQIAADPTCLTYAADQILQMEYEGWNFVQKEWALPQLTTLAGSQYACETCSGNKQQACPTCQGQMRHECKHCHGKREMTCPTCFGRGVMSSGEKCAACMQRGHVECNFCQGNGDLPCTACAGKGQVSCRTCDSRGTRYAQTMFRVFAQTDFKLMMQEDLPEVQMQHIRRLRPQHLLRGRAKISTVSREDQQGMVRLIYKAEFPLTDYDFQVGEQRISLTTLGLTETVFDCPPFMDRLLAEPLDQLRRAREGFLPAAPTLTGLSRIKFFRQSFAPGPEGRDLRRRYPFGISPRLVSEVPANLHYLLSVLTERPRLLAAIASNAVIALLLLFAYGLSSGPDVGLQFGDFLLAFFLVLANATAVFGTHYVVSRKTLQSFGVHADLDLAHAHLAIGKTGLISMAVTALCCALAWVF